MRESLRVSSHLPTPPDPMPLREALRGLRHVLRRGGETFRDTLPMEALPKPAADLAGAVMREVASLARGMDDVASGLAKSVLGADVAPAPLIRDPAGGPAADARFGTAGYAALRAILRHLGAPGVLVSEAAARRAHAEHRAAGSASAADLTLRLIEARVIRDATAAEAARVPGAALEPVAIFALLLWQQAERPEDEGEAALDAATDLAVALAGDVAAAVATGDAARLGALYTEFAAHV